MPLMVPCTSSAGCGRSDVTSCLADGAFRIVGKMVAVREDGIHVAIAWIVFEGEDEDAAEAFEVEKGGRLVACNLGKLSDWRKVAVMAAEGGG